MSDKIANTPSNGDQYSRSSSVIVTTIPANGIVGFDAYGQRFYFINSTAPIEAKTDLTGYKPYRKGTGENFTDDFRFHRFEVKNSNAYPVFIQVFIGFGEYLDTTSELVESFTNAVGSPYTAVAANTSLTFTGSPSGTQIQRKAIVVSNLDTANNIYVRDINDNYIAAVFPKSTISLQISGPVKVYNGTAGSIPVCISEIFYTYLP